MRQDQYLITVRVGARQLGVFDKFTGGDVTAEESKYRPGGMAPHVSLGGSVQIDNVVVSRLNTSDDDVHWLFAQCGKADMSVSRQPLDADGNTLGRPAVFAGKLTRVGLPEVDSEGSDPALLELELAPSGSVG